MVYTLLDSAGQLGQPLLDLISLGGPVVVALLIMSVFALALIMVKLWQFRRERVGRHDRSRQVLRAFIHGDLGAARRFPARLPSPLEQALSVAMKSTARRAAKNAVEDAVGCVALSRLHHLQQGLRALEAIAQIAPLLGLFGTVLGMIDAFRTLQHAGDRVDPAALAGGIWVALLTTACGLAVAIPVSSILTWFEARIENERVAIETMTGKLISHTLTDIGNNDSATETMAMASHAH